ncbi:MAG: hypothetical protein WCG80_17405 [Spirochaetales bacterium]
MKLLSCGLLFWLAASLAAQDSPSPPEAEAPPLPPGGGFIGAPLSSKIWDDFSLQNLATKGHKALGYATLTLATVAFALEHLAPAEPGSLVAVDLVSASSAVSAGTTVLAGIVSHWGKLTFEGDLVTWNNLHALTAVLGSTVIITGQAAGNAETRTAFGLAGAAMLLLAIMFEG